MLAVVRKRVLATSVDLDGAQKQSIEAMSAEICADIEVNGPFAPGDTLFAVGHYTEDRLVWFDLLTATLDDIMRDCGIPEDQRELQRRECHDLTRDFLRYHDGPKRNPPLLDG